MSSKANYTDRDGIRRAARAIFGTDTVLDTDKAVWPPLRDEQFEMARSLAKQVHEIQAVAGFTNGAGLECLAILLGLEILALHAKNISLEARRQMLSTVIAKGILHAGELIKGFEAGAVESVPYAPAEADTRH